MAHDNLRNIPLVYTLAALGYNDWKSRKEGTERYGTCPVHKAEKNRTSFSFNDDGRFQCFSCGAKGKGSIDLVIQIKKISFKEAVIFLESLSTQEPPIQRKSRDEASTQTLAVTENPLYQGTYDKFKVESEWLIQRGINKEILDKYGVFQYNNPNRKSVYTNKVMIPIQRFKDGGLVGYLARETTQAEPKYLFPKGVQKGLEVFGAWQLRQYLGLARLKIAYLVESPFCVMKFAQLGLPAVSCYGWSVSNQQAHLLGELAKGWIFLPDADKRSQAIDQVLPLLGQSYWVKAPEYPGSDPEHLTIEQIRSLT